MKAVRQLSLVKGNHRYMFRYQAGREADIINAFASMASDTEQEFDWFDAAVLSYQMGRRLELDLEEAGEQVRG
ncbi:MAG: hypothetical protein GXY55_17570 [Phycisphaerae bacterium]|nr:hypothetical protein [Phycisphaerae bacterium]